MLKSISWGQYLGVVLVLLLLYYAYVGLVYYRAELLSLVKGKGKGKVSQPAAAPALPSLIGGRGPLIGKSSAAALAPPPEAPAPEPAEDSEEAEVPAAEAAEQPAEAQLPATPEEEALDLPALDLPSAELNEDSPNEQDNNFATATDNVTKFTQETDATSFQALDGGMESAPDEYEPGFTVGVAQLGDYYERATEGQVSPEQLAEQLPGLENTDLLLSFFQASTRDAQQVTSNLYAEVD